MRTGLRNYPKLELYERGSKIVPIHLPEGKAICVVEPHGSGERAEVTGYERRCGLRKKVEVIPFGDRDKNFFITRLHRKGIQGFIYSLDFWS